VKFLLDHDVPDDLSYLLGQLGHEFTLLREVFRPIRRTNLFSNLQTRMPAPS